MRKGAVSGRAPVCSFIINWPIFRRTAQAIGSLGRQQLVQKVPVSEPAVQLKRRSTRIITRVLDLWV